MAEPEKIFSMSLSSLLTVNLYLFEHNNFRVSLTINNDIINDIKNKES